MLADLDITAAMRVFRAGQMEYSMSATSAQLRLEEFHARVIDLRLDRPACEIQVAQALSGVHLSARALDNNVVLIGATASHNPRAAAIQLAHQLARPLRCNRWKWRLRWAFWASWMTMFGVLTVLAVNAVYRALTGGV